MHSQPQVPANRLRELLSERKVKSIDIAALCRVNQSTVWRWEKTIIPRQHVAKIARRLGVSVPYLDGWTNRRDDPNGDDGSNAAEAVA